MNKRTGTIILGIIASIFAIDTALSVSEHATISEWFYNFLHNDPVVGFGVIICGFIGFLLHFWFFKPVKDK